jgi:hypothetical protein
VKVSYTPSHGGEYVGTSGDGSGGKQLVLERIYRISSFMSFFSIWITTAILMNYYREKLTNSIVYLVILALTLVYFLITYFYQLTIGNLLTTFLANDPVAISIMLGAFLSLSKPIGGLLFGVAFWNISIMIKYERNIRTYMIISGFGILLIFSANQAIAQIVSPYPPFGLATITVLNIATFLVLVGIYNSATLVSTNNKLLKSIYKRASESRLLGLIGQAEMEKGIQEVVKRIEQDKDSLERETQQGVELDEIELKKYVDLVIKEIRKEDKQKPVSK